MRRRNAHGDLRRVVNIQWEMSQRELDLFQGWYSYTLNNGAQNFTIDLLLDADNMQNYEVTPLSGLKVTHTGVNYWKVSVQVLALEQKYMSAEVVELFQYWGDTFDEMLTANDPLDLFINTTLGDYFAE